MAERLEASVCRAESQHSIFKSCNLVTGLPANRGNKQMPFVFLGLQVSACYMLSSMSPMAIDGVYESAST